MDHTWAMDSPTSRIITEASFAFTAIVSGDEARQAQPERACHGVLGDHRQTLQQVLDTSAKRTQLATTHQEYLGAKTEGLLAACSEVQSLREGEHRVDRGGVQSVRWQPVHVLEIELHHIRTCDYRNEIVLSRHQSASRAISRLEHQNTKQQKKN
jgi:hypothetical protein